MLLPGIGASLALWRPERIGPAARLGLVVPLGFAAVSLCAFVLALLRILYPATFLALLAALTAAAWVCGLRRDTLAAHVRATAGAVRAAPWALGVGLLALAVFAVLRLRFPSVLTMNAPVGFRYWADGLEVADAHRIPAASLQWGMLVPPTTSKAVLNAFNGGMSFVIGRDPLRTLGPLLWIGAVGLAAALWGLAVEVGLGLVAPLLWLLLAGNRLLLGREITRDLDAYRAETFGRLVAVAALVLAVRAFRREGTRRDAIAAGVLLGVAAGTHLVPVMIVTVFAGCWWLTRLVQGRERRPLVIRGLVAGGVALVAAGAILILPRGDLGFQGAGGAEAYVSFGPRFDPTVFLLTGSRTAAERSRRTTGWFEPPSRVAVRLVNDGIGRRTGRLGAVIAGLVLLGAAVAVVLVAREDLRPLGVVAVGLEAFMLLVALYFARRYHVAVLAAFGSRRMGDYASVPFLVAGLALLETGLRRLGGFRDWAPAVAGAGMVAVAAAFLLPRVPTGGGSVARAGQAVPILQWVRDRAPCDARILVNRRTIGTFESATGRAGVLEGMAPYLRPDILAPVVRLIDDAETFFHDPAAGEAFLTEHGVDEVIALAPGVRLGPLGKPLDGSADSLAALPFLRPVFQTSAGTVFQVTSRSEGTHPPRPPGRPGYRCGISP